MQYPLDITSEIGDLKSVLLHRPGGEIENLTPDSLPQLLFDDIPYLPEMQSEHDYFANVLRNQGVEVLYLEILLEEALASPDVRQTFIQDVLQESLFDDLSAPEHLREFLLGMPNDQLVATVITGVRKDQIPEEKRRHLYEWISDRNPFRLEPMPNLYFTRDPAAVIGRGLTINHMSQAARSRESLFMHYILRHHPRFQPFDIPIWYMRDNRFSLEGGDELVLSGSVVAIGVSERTSPRAVEEVAQRLLGDAAGFHTVMAVEIPKARAFMHLDTVFTMVSRAQFTVLPEVLGRMHDDLRIYLLRKPAKDGIPEIARRSNLEQALREVLELSEVDLIACGGGDPIAAAREQWNDGANTLAIAPGVVIAYDRNYVSNDVLRQHGINVIEIPGSELGRGRGGPRCMSMPLTRSDADSYPTP